MRTLIPFAQIAAVFAASLFATPGHATGTPRDRVFVASYGSDSNPCTFGSPCKTFQHAVDSVASGGEVTAIDSAGFGPIIIAQPVTITSPPGVEAGIVPVAGDDAIAINTSGDVLLRGLTIEGGESGVDGIAIGRTSTPPNTLAIVDCVIRHFTHDGIYLQPNASLKLSILNTIASNNGNDGIDLSPYGEDGGIGAVIDRSTTADNAFSGMTLRGSNAPGGNSLGITIVNSVSTANGTNGVYAYTTANGTPTSVMVRDTTSSNHSYGSGFFADGTSEMIFAHSAALLNYPGITIGTSASGYSFGDNHIYGNFPDLQGTLGSVGYH
jgi:hypothetical protein